MTTEELSLVEFMRQIQIQMKTNTDTINDNIKKEICEGTKEMKAEMAGLNKKIEEATNETVKIKKVVNDNIVANESRFQRIEKRLEDIVSENQKLCLQKRKRENENYGLPPSGKSYKDAVEKINKEKVAETELESQLHKARMDSEQSVRDKKKQVEAADKAAKRMDMRKENSEKDKVDTTEKKVIKLGDSNDLHDQEDWAWEESSDQWSDTVERKAKNKEEEKRKMRMNKGEMETRVIEKAKNIIGIGPIIKKSIDHFHDILGDYDEAKVMAAKEYLRIKLRFNEKELEEFEITDTQVSAGSPNILYIAVADLYSIRDIRSQMAECRDHDLQNIDFVPPQLYSQYMALGRYASEFRQKYSNMKTQIRYGWKDIELWVKEKGSDERFRIVNMEDIEEKEKLPKFDHTVRWRRKTDRPPRRRVSPT